MTIENEEKQREEDYSSGNSSSSDEYDEEGLAASNLSMDNQEIEDHAGDDTNLSDLVEPESVFNVPKNTAKKIIQLIVKNVKMSGPIYRSKLKVSMSVKQIFEEQGIFSSSRGRTTMYLLYPMNNFTFRYNYFTELHTDPLMCAYRREFLSGKTVLFKMENTELDDLIRESVTATRLFTSRELISTDADAPTFKEEICLKYNLQNEGENGKKDRKSKKLSNCTFIVTGKLLWLAGEAQSWSLARYLCGFDRRCDYLLAILYYWGNINSIKFGTAMKVDSSFNSARSPGPLGLVWLMIFFLCRKKIIPLPETILSMDHRPVILCGPDHIDIGFRRNNQHIKSWLNQDRNVKRKSEPNQILQLALHFFKYYGKKLKEGNWVLETRTGKIYSRENVLDFESSLKSENDEEDDDDNFCNPDQDILRRRLETALNKKGENVEEKRIYMTNPYFAGWHIPIPVDGERKLFEEMETMGKKLGNFLADYNASDGNKITNYKNEIKQLFMV